MSRCSPGRALHLGLRGALAAATLTAALPVSAQEPQHDGGPSLTFHGYLSQAYAISSRYQVLGVPKEGTADYRTAALQVRSDFTARDAFVVQFSQERLGQSPVMETRNEVDLAWVFYEHRFPGGLTVRAGKVKIPLGIYNETRFVGPLLPFFRPAEAFYGEGSFTTETVNGVVLSRTFRPGHAWSVDADLWGGEWSYVQEDNATRARVNNSAGAQVWLNTPLRGLRVGVGGYRGTASNLLYSPPGTKQARKEWHTSLDANLSRFRFSAELAKKLFPTGDYQAGYVHAGFRVTKRLAANLQVARSILRLDKVGPSGSFDAELSRDYAAGLNFSFRPDLVLKVENHWTRGLGFETEEAGLFAPPLKTRYVIVSLSALF